MATVTEIEIEAPVVISDMTYPISSDVYDAMVENGLIPTERRVYLWAGRLYEKMAKTQAHAVAHMTLHSAVVRRLPARYCLGFENPVRLDELHTPLPDMVVLRGEPGDYWKLKRYPDHREVALVAEIAVTSLGKDLGLRLSRYAISLPTASYLVVDVLNRRILVHKEPRIDLESGRGEYATVESVGPGQTVRLSLDGADLEPIPFEELLG